MSVVSADEYSMISAAFNLKRNTGYYTLQVFVPCGLIVCSSWVSFWIDPDAVPARVSLGELERGAAEQRTCPPS